MTHRLYIGIAIIIAIATFGVTPAARAADESSAYLDISAGYARIEDEDFLNSDDELRDDRTTWQIRGGARFTPYFGLEVGHVDFGEAENAIGTLSADGYTAAAALHFPLTDSFTLSARGGRLFWDARATAGPLSQDFDGEDNFYGLDARFGTNSPLGVVISYDRYSIDDTDVDVPSIGLEIGF